MNAENEMLELAIASTRVRFAARLAPDALSRIAQAIDDAWQAGVARAKERDAGYWSSAMPEEEMLIALHGRDVEALSQLIQLLRR